MPFDSRSITQDDLAKSMSKSKMPTNAWNSIKKYRESVSMIETGTTGFRKSSMFNHCFYDADNAIKEEDENYPRSHRDSHSNSLAEQSIGKIVNFARNEHLPSFNG